VSGTGGEKTATRIPVQSCAIPARAFRVRVRTTQLEIMTELGTVPLVDRVGRIAGMRLTWVLGQAHLIL
jgi:hypothetical protein